MTNPITLAHIRDARRLVGLSQEDMAARLEVSRTLVGMCEIGRPGTGRCRARIVAALEGLGVQFTMGGPVLPSRPQLFDMEFSP